MVSTRIEDTEANAFAAFLLMPDDLFLPVLAEGLDLADDNAVARVARKFAVPVGAVHYRAFLHSQLADPLA